MLLSVLALARKVAEILREFLSATGWTGIASRAGLSARRLTGLLLRRLLLRRLRLAAGLLRLLLLLLRAGWLGPLRFAARAGLILLLLGLAEFLWCLTS